MAVVHCIGVLVVDALSGPISSYPVPKVKTQVNTKTIKFFPGGGAANTGSALAQLGIDTAVFSKVGADLNGDFLRGQLRERGVDVSNIRISKKETTPFTFVGIHPNGDRSFIHTPGTNLTFCSKELNLKALFNCKFLLYQDMCVLPKLDTAAPRLLREARQRGIVTLLDECYGLGPNRQILEAALPFCDVALPSYDDMRIIYSGASPEAVAVKLHDAGCPRVVLKLGPEGCLVSHEKGRTRLASVATKIVDTTGAGDCFNAGFMAGLAHGLSDVDAAKIGAATAAECIRNLGGAAGIPKYKAVSRILK